jgi:thioredoxin reductase (NADPH)
MARNSDTGCRVVDKEYQTALPGVYAVGDVLCNHVKQAVIAVAEGTVAAIAIEEQLQHRQQLVADWAK